MNKLRYKILSILLIPVVLFSTTSFSVDKHICSDTVYSVSIFGEAEECGMEMMTCDDKMPESCSMTSEDCCENEVQLIEGSVANVITDAQLSFDTSQFITYFIISAYYLFTNDLIKPDHHINYSPPVVNKDIASLYQVFII